MPKIIDLSGQRFGRLVVVGRAENRGERVSWRCRCDCGGTKTVTAKHLRNGRSASCGCLSPEVNRARLTKHGHARAKRFTKEYRSWSLMKSRCLSESDPNYWRYGGRGITVCERWRDDFASFLADVGPAPGSGKSWGLERIDVNGNYEPGNVRWATQAEQTRNTRANVWLEHSGKRMIVSDWSREIGVGADTIRRRLRLGWSMEAVLSPAMSPHDRGVRGGSAPKLKRKRR